MNRKRTKHRLQAALDAVVPKILEEDNIPEHRACVFWNTAAMVILNDWGHETLLQGGTMMWPRVDPHQDDGVMHTHFSYVFEKHAAKAAIDAGHLPEMHVWAVVRDGLHIVDYTARFLPRQCEELGFMKWLGKRPPAALFGERPKRVTYRADPIACLIARDGAMAHNIPPRVRALMQGVLV